MQSKIKVLQVIPKLGYGGAETGCYDIAHYLPENNVGSYLITSGGELLKFVDKKKVKVMDNTKVGGSRNFEFASSNELWRASLDTIDFKHRPCKK